MKFYIIFKNWCFWLLMTLKKIKNEKILFFKFCKKIVFVIWISHKKKFCLISRVDESDKNVCLLKKAFISRKLENFMSSYFWETKYVCWSLSDKNMNLQLSILFEISMKQCSKNSFQNMMKMHQKWCFLRFSLKMNYLYLEKYW